MPEQPEEIVGPVEIVEKRLYQTKKAGVKPAFPLCAVELSQNL